MIFKDMNVHRCERVDCTDSIHIFKDNEEFWTYYLFGTLSMIWYCPYCGEKLD